MSTRDCFLRIRSDGPLRSNFCKGEKSEDKQIKTRNKKKKTSRNLGGGSTANETEILSHPTLKLKLRLTLRALITLVGLKALEGLLTLMLCHFLAISARHFLLVVRKIFQTKRKEGSAQKT